MIVADCLLGYFIFKQVRSDLCVCSCILIMFFWLFKVLYIAIVVFAPALALSQRKLTLLFFQLFVTFYLNWHHVIWLASMKKVDHSTIVNLTIHFCLNRLTRVGHFLKYIKFNLALIEQYLSPDLVRQSSVFIEFYYSNLTFIKLNHVPELCSKTAKFDLILGHD